MLALFCALLLFLEPTPWLGFNGFLSGAIAQVSPITMLTPQQALERLFTSPQIQSDWFAQSFLQQIPAPQIQAVLEQISSNLGEFQEVRETPDGFAVVFAGGTVPTQIQLNAEGQITSLFFQPASTPIALSEAIARVEASSYEASLLVTRDGQTLGAVNADTPLAVGSTFKLAVLAALAEQIEQGERRWDTVVELQPEWKSLPSGILQDWPVGSHLTLETLAILMISASDNTATDALIDIVGREAVEALALRNQPFLSTKDAFILKNPANADLLERYRSGDVETRRQVLRELGDRPLPSPSLFSGNPVSIDVEWFFTTQELCELIESVADLPAVQVNPGVASAEDWEQIAFKGGSEPGVLNLTTWLRNAENQTYCVSATWNSAEEPLNQDELTQFYSSVVAGLKDTQAD